MLWRFFGFLFTLGIFVFIIGASAGGYLLWRFNEELPDYEVLAKYEPPVMTRIHAGDGQLLAEYARERRLFVPIDTIPKQMIHAILSAEDKNFYSHGGIDFTGIARAVVTIVQSRLGGGGRLVGASTITQQVAKNFLLTSEQTYKRKLKEALLALRIEEAFTKDQILELYLNEIYLGLKAYGVAAASLNYYGKSLHELGLAEFAYLAALPKGPNNYEPFTRTEAAIGRRNWVIDRMVENGYVTPEDAAAAKAKGLDVSPRSFGAQIFAADYFAEEVRRDVLELYGETRLYEGGLSVRTTLDPARQKQARAALVKGLVDFDRERGWRGPVTKIDVSGDWGAALAEIKTPSDIQPWRIAVALQVSPGKVIAGLVPEKLEDGTLSSERRGAELPLAELQWARAAQPGGGLGSKITSAEQVLEVGDVVYISPDGKDGTWRLVQLPEVEGAIVALDPHTGRVSAMVGGFSYGRSKFNRAVQARRQPGSSFKPFVYAAALDNGFTPASVVMDAPFAIDQGGGQGIWRPQNYGREYYGPSTLRLGIEKSRNVMTVRLAEELGMDVVADYARRFNIDENMRPVLAMSLGAGETTLMKMTAAYGMLANGGKRITPSLIDRIQDRFGKTVYRHDTRECPDCEATEWRGQPEPQLPDNREQVIAAETAYQITSMMEGVVQRGTATILKKLGRPIAGKTGTSNDERDAWFVGYTPDLVIGVYVGFDSPKPMGRGETGGGLAAPIFADLAKVALKDEPVIPFRVPPGINLIRINSKTGALAQPGEDSVIVEAFKPGELPPQSAMDVIGGDTLSLAPAPVVPTGLPGFTGGIGGASGGATGGAAGGTSQGLTTGTGGLY